MEDFTELCGKHEGKRAWAMQGKYAGNYRHGACGDTDLSQGLWGSELAA